MADALPSWVVAGTAGLLLVVWFAVMRRRFPGPPAEVLHQLRPATATAADSPSPP